MNSARERGATLVDLLDRILDRGVVLTADVIISVAGIPLLGLNLRAALAGMETMLSYGLMQAWDKSIRLWEQEQRQSQQALLNRDERVLARSGE